MLAAQSWRRCSNAARRVNLLFFIRSYTRSQSPCSVTMAASFGQTYFFPQAVGHLVQPALLQALKECGRVENLWLSAVELEYAHAPLLYRSATHRNRAVKEAYHADASSAALSWRGVVARRSLRTPVLYCFVFVSSSYRHISMQEGLIWRRRRRRQ